MSSAPKYFILLEISLDRALVITELVRKSSESSEMFHFIIGFYFIYFTRYIFFKLSSVGDNFLVDCTLFILLLYSALIKNLFNSLPKLTNTESQQYKKHRSKTGHCIICLFY